MTRADEGAALCELKDDAVAWILENPRRVEPTPVRGWPGIYNVDLDPSRFGEMRPRP